MLFCAKAGLHALIFTTRLEFFQARHSVVDAGIESIDALESALQIAADVFKVVKDAEALLKSAP